MVWIYAVYRGKMSRVAQFFLVTKVCQVTLKAFTGIVKKN